MLVLELLDAGDLVRVRVRLRVRLRLRVRVRIRVRVRVRVCSMLVTITTRGSSLVGAITMIISNGSALRKMRTWVGEIYARYTRDTREIYARYGRGIGLAAR